MKKAIILAFLGVSAVVCLAQSSRFPPINLYTGDPTGNACTGNIIQQSSTTGKLYTCQGGTMQAGSGSGSVSGQTAGTIPLATGATTIGSPSHLDDGVTTSGAITSTEPINGPSAKFTGTVATTAALTSTLPTLDIRNPAFAGGAVCDGATNSGPAIQAAINALPVGGAIMLPTNCFWDNSTQPTWSSVSGPITLVVVGTLNTKTSIVIPNNQFINVVGQGGGSNTTSFASPSQIANISVSGSPKGVLGTAITVTPNGSSGNDFGVVASFTPSTMTGLYVGTGITVAGTSTCTISTITRVSGTVTATLSAACHIPPGVIVSVAGVTDSGFNGTHTGGASAGPFDVVDSDYVANTVSWHQTAADASSTGGTITGFNEDSYENVQITAVTSTTATAKFYRSHAATERWGVVGLIVNGNTHSSVIQNLQITSPGTQLWIPQSYETRIINVSGSNTGGCNSDPTLSTFNPGIDVGASTWIHFEHIGFTSFCEPWSLHMSQTYNLGFADAGPIYVDDSFLLRGIKMDHGGFGVYWDKSVCDQCARAIVTYDPTNYWNGNSQVVTIDKTFLQDNPDGFPTYLVYQLTPINGASSAAAYARIGTVGGYGLAGSVNAYFTGTTGNPSDLELAGEQAGLAPAILPYATVDVVQSPAGWATASPGNDFCTTTSTTALAPDGTSTAGTLAVNTGSFDIIGQSSITPAIGDRVLFGGWESGAPQNGGIFIDNSSSSHYSMNWTGSGYSKVSVSQWDLSAGYWHPNVGLATVTASDGTAGQGLRLGLGCSAAGATYWMPFVIYIPASANIPAAEVHRWRRQLLHGVVPANMPAGVLAINPAHKLYWGNDTNLYRGAAGVLQTDSAMNIGAGKTYQINGTQVASTNLGDFSATAPTTTGQVPVWNSGTGKYAPGAGTAVTVVSPSGDTTGATDGAAIQSACTSSKSVQLKAATYYTGASNSTITLSTPCALMGAGPGQTTLQNEGTNNTVINMNYSNTGNSNTAGRISNLSILQDPAVTPTGGTGIAIGTGSVGTYSYYPMVDHILLVNLWRGMTVNTGVEVLQTDSIDIYSNVSGGGGSVYYNAAIPSGGGALNKINTGGTNSDITIAQSDTTSWGDLHAQRLLFTQVGTTHNITFTNFVSEDTSSRGSCAVDAGTGSHHPARIHFVGGQINASTNAFCNFATIAAPNGLSVSNMTFLNTITLDGSAAAANTQAYSWGTGAASIGGYVTAPLGPNDTGSPGQWAADGSYYYTYDPINLRWQRIGWDGTWAATTLSMPTFSITGPLGGPTVTITASAGASICDTTNGTTPAAATPPTCSVGSTYSTPITLTTGQTLKAIATQSGLTNSAVQSYTVPQLYDNFTGTTGTNITAHTADSGQSWMYFTGLSPTGVITIQSNAIKVTTSTTNVSALINATPGTADYSVSLNCTLPTVSTASCGTVGRALNSTTDTDYQFLITGGNCNLYRALAGAYILLANITSCSTHVPGGITNGGTYTVTLTMAGTSISGWVNGTNVTGTITNSDVTAAGFAGVFLSAPASNVSADVFLVQ